MNTQRKILIIEDESFLVDLYKVKFEQEGFEVEVAFDGLKGLEAAKERQPDLILLDIVMPGLDGYEILRELKEKEQTKNIPILVFTNLGQKTEIAKGLSMGADAYMVKANFTPAQVVKEIRKLLGESDVGKN